jgi:hypothetical protein
MFECEGSCGGAWHDNRGSQAACASRFRAIAEDPIQKLLLGRDPVQGAALASQPTLSRFENAPRRADLYRMGEALMQSVIELHRKRLGSRKVKHVTIDLDPTDDPTHGGQQLTFFNGHYDSWCYLPVVGFVSFNRESEQFLFCYVLRPGNAPAKQGAIGILDRVIEQLRAAFPKARILVRLDGGSYASSGVWSRQSWRTCRALVGSCYLPM